LVTRGDARSLIESFVFAAILFRAPSSSGNGAVISGQVVLAEGQPAVGIRVSAQEVSPTSGQSTLMRLAETDDMGRCRLEDPQRPHRSDR
jgi:hypothetical protein